MTSSTSSDSNFLNLWRMNESTINCRGKYTPGTNRIDVTCSKKMTVFEASCLVAILIFIILGAVYVHKNSSKLKGVAKEAGRVLAQVSHTTNVKVDHTPSKSVVKDIESQKEYDLIRSSTDKPIVMLVFAPWCSHCKPVLPMFRSACDRLSESGVDCEYITVDTTKVLNPHDPEIHITGYPFMIIILEDGTVEDTQPVRSVDEFVRHIDETLKSHVNSPPMLQTHSMVKTHGGVF